MPRDNPRPFADIFHNETTAWVVLAVSLVITFLAAYITREYIERRAEERFAFEVADARERIAKRMVEYEQVLRGGVALFETLDGEVTREQWRRYIEALQIDRFFPGIQGVGYARMLPPDDLPAHIEARWAEGFPDYAVTPAGERAIYSAITFLEPFDARNRRAFGYDMFSEPVRRAAMEQARDTGLPAVSGRVTLMQETGEDVQAGFLMYLPAYRPGLPTGSVAERRAALHGFVYSPFRTRDLMRGILGSEKPALAFELFDSDLPLEDGNRLYSSDPALERPTGRPRGAYRTTTTIELPGRTWTARFRSRPSFDHSVESSQPLMIALGGVTVDLLLFAIIWSLAGERKRVQQKAEGMTAELRSGSLLLQERENRLAFGEEMAGLGSWRWDAATGSRWWSDGFYRLLGVEPRAFEPSAERLRRFLPPAAQRQVEQAIEQVFRTGEQVVLEHLILRADGEERILHVRYSPIQDQGGCVTGYVGTALDITERKRTESALAAEHALLQSIIDTIPDLVVLKDAGLVYRTVNAAFLRFVGKPREAIIGKSDFSLFSEAEAEQYRSDDRQILVTGQPLTLVERVTGADGQRWFQVAKVPLRDAEGDVRGVLMSVRDISALKIAEEDLRRKHAELAAVFATDHVLIAVMDREFRFLQVNAAYAASAGYEAHALIGKRHFDLFPHAENEAIFREVVETGRTFSTHARPFEPPHTPGAIHYWDWTLSPLHGADGAVEGVTLTLIDATEREHSRLAAEEAWRAAQAELEQRVWERTRDLEIAYRELETFSYSVSHDLRGPLRAIDGFTQILAEDYGEQLDANGRSYIARVHNATLRMAALIDGLLNLSRLCRSELKPARVDLSRCAGEIIRLLRTGEPDRGVAVAIEPGLTTVGDPILLRVVLQNLIENAWKFTARRTDAAITLGRTSEEGRELFFVQDNGIGFDIQYAQKLFKPFERLHTDDEFQGTGIGLATVRRIIQRHGGEVWAKGVPGEGTTVYFTLQSPAEPLPHST